MPAPPYNTNYLQFICDYCGAQIDEFCRSLHRSVGGNFWGLSGPTVPHINRLRKMWDAEGIHKYPYLTADPRRLFAEQEECRMLACNHFWLVFRMPNNNECAWTSTKVHTTVESAREEALRLASANPGRKFYVADFVGYAEVTQPATFTTF